MNLNTARRLVIAAPLLVVLVLEFSRWALGPWRSGRSQELLIDGLVLIAAVGCYFLVSRHIGRRMEELQRENREMRALRNAGLDISADLSLDGLLQRIVDQARGLLGCRYGALAVYDLNGELETFITSGIDRETRRRIGRPPVGKGLLGLPLNEDQTLLLQELNNHPRSAGFPPDHPVMRSLLAVPVVCREPFRGNLYLSEKTDRSPMTLADEETLNRFAAQAAVAVDNAQLHAKVAGMAVLNERLRLAREMHDGQAQVLAFVNTKAQVIEQLLDKGELEPARRHLEQLAQAAREVYADVREGILSLRTAVDHDHDLAAVLREYSHKWQDQSRIPLVLEIEGQARYGEEPELQVLRVIQEALANVRKHSRCSEARLRAELHDHGLTVEVEDDGIGFSQDADCQPPHLQRFGLATMRERCEAIGARLEIQSVRDQGTLVRVSYQHEGATPPEQGA